MQANNPPNRFRTLLRMLKLPHCVFLGFSVIVAEAISTANVPVEIAVYGFVSGFLLSAASIILNEEHSDSASSEGSETVEAQTGSRIHKDTVALAVILGVIGLSVASKLGNWTLLIAITIMIFAACQNVIWARDRLASGAFASGNVALLFILGGLAVGVPTLSLVILVAMVFITDLGREVIKDLATSKVEPPALRVVNGKRSGQLLISGVALSVVPALFGIVSISYLPLIVIFDAGMLLTAYSIRTNPTLRTAARDKNYMLLWMSFAVLAFIIGTL